MKKEKFLKRPVKAGAGLAALALATSSMFTMLPAASALEDEATETVETTDNLSIADHVVTQSRGNRVECLKLGNEYNFSSVDAIYLHDYNPEGDYWNWSLVYPYEIQYSMVESDFPLPQRIDSEGNIWTTYSTKMEPGEYFFTVALTYEDGSVDYHQDSVEFWKMDGSGTCDSAQPAEPGEETPQQPSEEPTPAPSANPVTEEVTVSPDVPGQTGQENNDSSSSAVAAPVTDNAPVEPAAPVAQEGNAGTLNSSENGTQTLAYTGASDTLTATAGALLVGLGSLAIWGANRKKSSL